MFSKDKIIEECLEILNRDDVKNEFKNIMRPIIEMLLKDIYPYIYLSIIFVVISFLLILGIFVLLMRNKILSIKMQNRKNIYIVYNGKTQKIKKTKTKTFSS